MYNNALTDEDLQVIQTFVYKHESLQATAEYHNLTENQVLHILAKPGVASEKEAFQWQKYHNARVSTDMVMALLLDMLMTDMADFQDMEETTPGEIRFVIKDLDRVPSTKRKAIKSINYQNQTVTLVDKIQVIDRILKLLNESKKDKSYGTLSHNTQKRLSNIESLQSVYITREKQ